MTSPRSLLFVAFAAVWALTACSGGSAEPAESPHEVCQSADQADSLVDLWLDEELSQVQVLLQEMVRADEAEAPCAGEAELQALRGAVEDNGLEGSGDAVNAWLAAIGRDDVNVYAAKREAREESASAEAASDHGAVVAGREKVGFPIGECPLDDDLCDLRDFNDDYDPTNGVILLETQFNDEPGFSGAYYDDAMREKITEYLKEWMPPQIKKVKLYYYADQKGDMPVSDVEPYATIELK
ncbi:hypothetical protein [Brevibacterium linens]|uniref:Lipoprotein n=1 Tax=Brevibacterium linens TaxID=1703 RepID=A0A2H1IKY9_BRELN|nr:hypothetical protein [Brevibacterium linens]SMX75848.1 hypothetical protein BLIN101_01311 [Brevibacterium linens]